MIIETNRKLWLEALRSGQHRQIQHRMSDGCGGFCVLGLAIEVLSPLKFPSHGHFVEFWAEEFGLSSWEASGLASKNDAMKGLTFPQLADYLEVLFTKGETK